MLTQEKLSTPNTKSVSSGMTLDNIDKALETALFYGFTPIKCPISNREDGTLSKDFEPNICLQKIPEELERSHKLDLKLCILRNFIENKFKTFSFPLMISYRTYKKGQEDSSSLNLTIIGAQGSIAEAIILKATIAILGNKDRLKIEINSVGDKDSFGRFEKDFVNHVKKYPGNNSNDPFDLIKKDFYKEETEETSEFRAGTPKPINYLSPASIKHFKEVLEYLESFNVPYDLNHFLIPNKQHCHQTIFRIQNGEDTLALGVRHQNIAKKLKIRRDIPILTVAIKDSPDSSKKINIKKIKPRFFLVQFGTKAKIKSLIVIEILREAGIPIQHLLIKDKLLGQLNTAESLQIPYILILGEKEALENSVLVRNIETRVQENVPVSGLVGYLRKIKI